MFQCLIELTLTPNPLPNTILFKPRPSFLFFHSTMNSDSIHKSAPLSFTLNRHTFFNVDSEIERKIKKKLM